MKPQFLLLTLLLVLTISESQTVCFQYAGGVTSCDRGEGRYSTQVPSASTLASSRPKRVLNRTRFSRPLTHREADRWAVPFDA
jgi:hypothetical protein